MKKNVKHKIKRYKFYRSDQVFIEYGISPLNAWSDEDDWVIVKVDRVPYICLPLTKDLYHSYWRFEEV